MSLPFQKILVLINRNFGIDVANRIPTKVGDVLILRTNQSFSTFAVGPVMTDGQQDFHDLADVSYLSDRTSAVFAAQAQVGIGGQVFFMDIDADEWSKL